MVKVTVLGETREYKDGVTLAEVAKDYQDKFQYPIVLGSINGNMRELFRVVKGDSEIKFLTTKDPIAQKAYTRSAIMLLLKSFEDVMGRDHIDYMKVEFTVGNGYYITYKGPDKITDDIIAKAKARMKELIDKDIPFEKSNVSLDDAIAIFKERKMKDKETLFKYRRYSTINIYSLEDYKDYYYGFMLPSTGYIKWVDVVPYDEGIMMVVPYPYEPDVLKPLEERKTLFNTLKATTEWNELMGVSTVGELNDLVCSGGINDMILVQEALQERRIGEIAEDIVRRGGVKFVMIAGPSSSGKTTFSHRLSVELKTYGLKPHPIPVDDYFVNREDTPKDENGEYNFECLEAIDVEQFNKDMSALLRGERVELPTFNFKAGKREYKGNYKQLGPDDILVIEGIHGLNDKMSYSLPSESKYKIYISALTSINIDEHNRIPTTDGRLLRRMVRDARTRGTSAKNTIKMWPSVRKGEEENIFPFQENADAMFNSILIYELAAFKTYAEPLLFEIGKDEPEYPEAKRLLKFLEYFVGIDPKVVPANSICREFIGGSYFNV